MHHRVKKVSMQLKDGREGRKIRRMLPLGRLTVVFLFLVLFTLQISGLSCLDEWTPFPQGMTLSQASPLDDECPCHFTFVSSPALRVSWTTLVMRVTAPPPTTYAFDARFLLFRPPVVA